MGPEDMSIEKPLPEVGLVEFVGDDIMCEGVVRIGIEGCGAFSNRCSGCPSIK